MTSATRSLGGERCFYCKVNLAWTKFQCPACPGPAPPDGSGNGYLLCKACLKSEACLFCKRSPNPEDAFTDPDFALPPLDAVSSAGSEAMEIPPDDTVAPSVDASAVWVLVELSTVLLYRADARVKGPVPDGFDTQRGPFYIRPGADEFLRKLCGLTGVHIALSTTMFPRNYGVMIDCLAQKAFGKARWDEQAHPVFRERSENSERTLPDGRPAPCLNMTGVMRYAKSYIGPHMSEERIILIQSLKKMVPEAWRPNVLLIPAMRPSEPAHLLKEELEQVFTRVRELLSRRGDLRPLEEPSYKRPFDDLMTMDENLVWASESDLVQEPVRLNPDGIEHDEMLLVERAGAEEWTVTGPGGELRSCENGVKYDWNGARFHHYPAPNGPGRSFEVHVLKGLVRVGWSTAHASLNLGKDKEGFPHIGYGATGKICVGGKFSDFGECFEEQDLIGCELTVREGCELSAVFRKNGVVIGSRQFGASNLKLYPHVTGKQDFQALVRMK